jgi:hypothetical protein
MGLLDVLNAASGAAMQGVNTYQQLQQQQEAHRRQAQQDALQRAELAMKLGDNKGLMGALRESGLNVDPTAYLQQQQAQAHAQVAQRNSEMLGKLSTAVKAGTLDPTQAETIYRQYDTAYRGANPLFTRPAAPAMTEYQQATLGLRQQGLDFQKSNAEATRALRETLHATAGQGRGRLVPDYQPDGTVQYVQAAPGVKVHAKPGGALVASDNGDGTSTYVEKKPGAVVKNHQRQVQARPFDELKARKIAEARVGVIVPGVPSTEQRPLVESEIARQKQEHIAAQRKASGQPSALQSMLKALEEDKAARRKGGQ